MGSFVIHNETPSFGGTPIFILSYFIDGIFLDVLEVHLYILCEA